MDNTNTTSQQPINPYSTTQIPSLSQKQQGFYDQLNATGGHTYFGILNPTNPDYGDIVTAMNAYTQSKAQGVKGIGQTTSADADLSAQNLANQQSQIQAQLAAQKADPNGPYATSLNTGQNTPGYTNLSLNSLPPMNNPQISPVNGGTSGMGSTGGVPTTNPISPVSNPTTDNSVRIAALKQINPNISDDQIQQFLAAFPQGGQVGSGGSNTSNTSSSTTTPVSSTTGSTGFGPSDNSIQSLLQQYTDANKYSDQYLSDIGALNSNNAASANITAGNLGFNANAETDHTMSTGAVSGYEADQGRQASAKIQALAAASVPLQQKLAIDQAQRQAAIDVASTKLGIATTSVPYGASNTNLITGQTNSSGVFGTTGSGTGISPATGLPPTADSGQILGYLAASGLQVNKNNAPFYMAAVQNGKTAQDIINAQAGAAGTKSMTVSGVTWKFDPASGTWVQPNPNAINSTTSSGSSTTASGGSSTGGYQAGQLTALLKSQGKTADDATLQSLWKQYGNGGSYSNDTAHNSVIFNGMGGKTTGVLAPAKSASSSSSSPITNPLSTLSSGALTRLTTGDFRSGDKYSTQQNTIDAEIRKTFPDFNPQIAKANGKAITDLTGQQAEVTRGITAADDNFGLLTTTFKNSGVNDRESPLANQFTNWAKGGIIGNQKINNFKSAVSTLQTEYATVLGRGGDVTDSVRKSAANVINGNYSMNDLISLHDYIDKESKNVINSYTKTIGTLVSGGSNTSSSTSGGTSGQTSSGIGYTIQ